jgi:hypothetical protein
MSKQRVDGLMIEHLIYILFKLLDISLNCLWNSKRYCKDPLHARATMKETRNEENIGSQIEEVNVGDVVKQFVMWNFKSLDIIMLVLELIG